VKIFVLAPRENWICDRIADEWKRNIGDISTDNIAEADIIWLLAGWCWNHVPQQLLSTKKVVLTVHHIVPEKFTQEKQQEFAFRDQFIDAYHVPNRKTADLVSQMTSKPIFIACYWYDPESWKEMPREECKKSLGLPEEKFIVGSFQRDTEGGTRNPKLEKGPDLFCDYLSILKNEKDLHILLGGWRREYVIDRLEAEKIPYTFIEKASLEMLGTMYNACDLYVVGSRYEGGPQAILEAASTKTPIISRDVGIAIDVLDPYCIVDIPHQTWIPHQESVERNYKNVQKFNIMYHKNNYLQMFERINK
jgi:glycosyltransferase involved in cell wall biosynthesis